MFDYKHVFGERGHLYNRASRQFPLARATERQLLLDRLDLRPGQTFCDAPAGGGYLADGAAAAVGDGLNVVCVEPAGRFAAGIDARFGRVVAPLDDVPLADGSVDRVGSLAGLHHLPSKTGFYREAFRLLARGGRIALADVREGSPPATFLNGPCDRLSETGHDGRFLSAGELTRDLRACGFIDVIEEHCPFTWNFPDRDAMVRYCKDLFGLTKADEARVLTEIRTHLSFAEAAGETRLDWSLVYAVGTKPG